MKSLSQVVSLFYFFVNSFTYSFYFFFLENIKKIASWYKESFSEIYFSPVPATAELEERFFDIMGNIYEKHSKTMFLMAMGAQEIKKYLKDNPNLFFIDDIQTRLDNFYKSRIAIRIVSLILFLSFFTLF